ncbi:MAG: ATP-dependent DNA ligase [Sulfuricaulis sp.]
MSDPRTLSATLAFCQGSSDKVYQVQATPEGDGFVVQFQYGRRGGPMQSGRKTASPVPFEEAEKIFAKLVKEKIAKGYSTSDEGTPYQDTSTQVRVSGVLPQLLNPVEEDAAAALIDDPNWCAQEKFDGNRTLVRVLGGEVTGINRKGLTIPLPAAVAAAAARLPGNDFVLDGELVGDVHHAFDVIRHDGNDITNHPLSVRLTILSGYAGNESIRVVPTHLSAQDKRTALAQLRSRGAEGIVFKRKNAAYAAGRPNSGGDALKLKFVATATVRIGATNAGKRSVAMQLLDASGAWQDVGNVTIPPNHAIPAQGTLAEIRYLYSMRGGSLVQPCYLGARQDIDEADCTTAQLQYKGEQARAA